MALHEMNPGYRRQVLQIVQGETQRTIHHAVDREAMLLRIDVGQVGGVLLHEVEPGRRDDARIILQRSVVSDMIDAHSGAAARLHETRGLAVSKMGIFGVRLGYFGLGFRLGRLASRGPFCACAGACCHTGQCRSVFQEPPPPDGLVSMIASRDSEFLI